MRAYPYEIVLAPYPRMMIFAAYPSASALPLGLMDRGMAGALCAMKRNGLDINDLQHISISIREEDLSQHTFRTTHVLICYA